MSADNQDKEEIDNCNFKQMCIEEPSSKTTTVLEQLPKPLLNAKQLLPLLDAVFGHKSSQMKQEEAIDSCISNKNTFVLIPKGVVSH